MRFLRSTCLITMITLMQLGCVSQGGDSGKTFNFADPGSASDDLVVRIISSLPASTNISLTNSTSESFSITASGKSSLSYSWKLDGSTISSSAGMVVSGSSLTTGSHTLVGTASDGATSDSRTWTVKKNAAPVLSSPSPSASTTYKINYAATVDFSVTATDANNDTLTYTWLIDNATGGPFTVNNNTATFAPTTAYIGSRTVSVQVNDGTETTTQSWTVEVNYFSEECNRLQVGQICTLVGDPSIGNGLTPSDNQNKIKIRPRYILDDGSGNLFVSDDVNHVVWFLNQSAAAISIGGQSVAAGKFKVILGSGASGAGTTEPAPTDFKINTPEQLYWDSGNQTLYVAEVGNNRVIRLLSTGVTEVVMGGSSGAGSTVTPANGNTLDCNQATGVVMVGTDLYVACYGRHLIRKVDTATAGFPTLNVAGTYNTAGNVDGVATSTGRTQNPRQLQSDTEGNIYWNGYSDCTIKAYRPPSLGGSLTWWSGQGDQVVINAGDMKTIAGGTTTSCTNANGTPKTATRFQNPLGFTMKPDRSGFFVSTNGGAYQIRYANNSGSAVTIGNVSVSAYQVAVIGNTAGSTGFNGDGQTGALTKFNQIYSLSLSNTLSKLYISDLNNSRGRVLDLSIAAGEVTTILGAGRVRNGFIGDTEIPVTDTFLNNPLYLFVDDTNRKLLISDTSNQRIRTVDMLKGTIATLLGRSGTAIPIENDIPSNVIVNSPHGLAMIGSNLYYADQGSSNCLVRGWNRTTSNQTLFNVFMNADSVWTVAGDYGQGCVNYPGTGSEGGAALNAGLNLLEGLTTDGTNLYVANYQNHCVLKIATNGNISTHVGSCGVTADAEGHPTTAARLRYPSQIYIDPSNATVGSLFIADRVDQTTSKIRYVNMDPTNSVTVAGILVPPMYVKTLTTCNRCYGVAASAAEFCYASGANGYTGDNNVVCVNRTTGLTTLRVGPPAGGVSGGGPFHREQEGVTTTSARMDMPYGLAFDSSGNLYIADRYNHIIRYVRRN